MSTTSRQIRQTGIVTEDFGSTITGVNHIDTYGCFPLGETEHEAVEYDILASILASECLDDGGIGFEELPEEIQKPWIAGSPWCAHSDDELWTVTYDHDGWLRELAEASVDLLSSQYDLGEVVHSVEFTGEVWSPQFYNFSTDGYMARWTIDTDALEQWLADNGAVLGDGRGIPGFYRTADDDTWYLGRALEEYLEAKIPDYVSDMYSYLAGNGVEDQYIEVELTEAGRAWVEEYKRAK